MISRIKQFSAGCTKILIGGCAKQTNYTYFLNVITPMCFPSPKPGVGNLRPPGRIRTTRPFGTALEVTAQIRSAS